MQTGSKVERLICLVWRPEVVVTTAVFLALFLYWPVLKLPLLFDTLLHIRLTEGLSWGDVWLPSTDFGFYRPFVFLPFLLFRSLFNGYPAMLLHGLNWAQHALNVGLLAWLAWRLWGKQGRALTAGLLFATYPFAYQAVVSYGNSPYPTGTGLILLALHSYLTARQADKARRWWVLTAILFIIGLLTHETVVLYGFFAFMIYDLQRLIKDFPAKRLHAIIHMRPSIVFIMAGAIYAIGYQFLPRGLGPQLDFGGNAPLGKVLYLLQTAVYPSAWLAHQLPNVSAVTIIGGGLLLLLGLTVWAVRSKENWLAVGLGWSWWGITALLIGITLPTYYILHGARLTYLGGAGVALLWAVVLDSLPSRWLWGSATLLVTISSFLFVQERLQAFEAIAAPVKIVTEVMTTEADGEGILLVNLPAWSSPPRNTYAVGVEYATIMGSHLFAEELVRVNLGQERPVWAIALPDLLTDPGYPYGIHEQSPLSEVAEAVAPVHVFITEYEATRTLTNYRGVWQPTATKTSSFTASFGPYQLLSATAIACKNDVEVSLTWQQQQEERIESAPLATLSIFVQLLGEDGRLLAQADGPPLQLRPDQLPTGGHIIDRRILTLPDGEKAASLLMGVYDFTTGQRLLAQDEQGVALPDNALGVTIRPCL